MFIIDELLTFAGTEKHLFHLCRDLDKDAFISRIVVFKSSDAVTEKFTSSGIDVYSLNLEKIYGIRAFFKFIALVSIIRSFRPHIVQTFHFRSDTFGVCAANLEGNPIIISSRRDMGHLKTTRQIYLNRLINPFINNVISVCDRVADGLSKTEKVPTSKIRTIYNGVDLKKYETGYDPMIRARRQLGIKSDAFVVGIACILRPEKDVLLFLRAISELSSRIGNLRILVVGDGETRGDLTQYSKKNGLLEKTMFTGYVDDVRPYIQSMDVACLTPKENEGLSNVILEEMAMGKPVIATDVGGNAELVVDGVTGFIIEPGDKHALARRIMSLHQNHALRESMGFEGRKRVEEHFTIQTMIKNMEAFYFDLLRSTIGAME